jgi:hypothetical protein
LNSRQGIRNRQTEIVMAMCGPDHLVGIRHPLDQRANALTPI